MKNTIPETIKTDRTAASEKEKISFKTIAMGGPGLTMLIKLPALKILFVNRQFENYFGYTNEDIAHESIYFTDLLGNYQLDRFLYQINISEESLEAQSRYVIYRLKNKNGTVGSYYLYAAPAGEGIFQLVLHPNLSKWNVPFTSFVTRELFLEHFNSEDFGTFEWIMPIDKFFLSEGICEILEINEQPQEITRQYLRSFIHPADKARLEGEAKQAIVTGNDLNIDFRIITAKKNVKIIHCLARTVSKAGKPVKFAGSIRDITGPRIIEEDLKNKVTELYHSNKELEEFAYIASHDMQEPLRKITVFSERLSDKYKDVLTGDGAMYLSRMVAAAENMRLLIDGLLEFSRITKTKQPFESVDLNAVLSQVRTDLELVIEDTATIINSQPLPTVEAVASQMKQLFTNIIGNAIKFHKPGVPPVITIESRLLSPADHPNMALVKNTDYHIISITDNGVGFEEEYAVRIFQVFQRLHGKSEYPGSGIGLAICKKILEYHKGIIYAENLPGVGARFTFILPQVQTAKENN